MKFKLFWREIQFLEVEKINNIYYTKIITENIEQVEREGYPTALLNNIKVKDKELPIIIRRRIPKPDYLAEKLNGKLDVETQILDYINETKCKRATDFLTLEVEGYK